MWVKAKVDTGARTSAIHARNVRRFVRDGRDWVRFTVLPRQSSTGDAVHLEAPLEDERWVRSSSGQREFRPVVLLPVTIAGMTHVVEFTLSHRPQMGFRILIGRQALRGRFQVDPSRSFLGDQPPHDVRLANKAEGEVVASAPAEDGTADEAATNGGTAKPTTGSGTRNGTAKSTNGSGARNGNVKPGARGAAGTPPRSR